MMLLDSDIASPELRETSARMVDYRYAFQFIVNG